MKKNKFYFLYFHGDWGLGIGDWGCEIKLINLKI